MDNIFFKNGAKVLEYLWMEGWQVSNGAFYNHCAWGWLKKSEDGYRLSDVERYAKERLKKPGTGEKSSTNEYRRQALRKLKADTRRSNALAKKAEYDLQVTQGKHIPREDLDIEFASRAAIFSNALKDMYKKRAMELVEMVGGDKSRAMELANALTEHTEEALSALAAVEKFEVVFQKNK